MKGEESDSDGVECPTCHESGFDKISAMKKHHYMAHGESIAGYEFECDWCGEVLWKEKSYQGQDKKFFCDKECEGNWKSENKTGENHPRFGSGGIVIECEWCGESVEKPPSHVEPYDHHFCSLSCRGEWLSENWVGEDCDNWKGGAIDYYGTEWISSRREIRKRDGNQCRICGRAEAEIGRKPSVHHITPVRSFDDPNEAHSRTNMIQLCQSCHVKAEHGYVELPENPDNGNVENDD